MKKVALILFTSIIAICVGTSVAYYNTSSFGYDNANVLSYEDECLRIFYLNIDFKKTKKEFEHIKEKMPEKYLTI